MSHPLVSEALQVLDKLPEGLYYHNKQHTVNVISAAVKCAELDGISSRDLELLAIAAAWHDTGYINRRNQNEIIGADLAREGRQNPSLLRKRILSRSSSFRDGKKILNVSQWIHFRPSLKLRPAR
jgi:HD superfamily phosphodiesterase